MFTTKQKDFIIDCFRIITNMDADKLKETGYFDGLDDDDIYEMSEEIENKLNERTG